MKLFSNTFAKRNTAILVLLVLLVWLFALASGVANACLLEARGTHAYGATAGYSEAAHAPGVSPGHAGAVADRDHANASYASSATCLKACGDGTYSVPKPDLTATQTDPGPALLVAVLWTAATPVVSPPSRMDHVQPSAPERPIRVRYSRLAL